MVINCTNASSTCVANFTSGSTVMLTAAPAGTFGGWQGVTSVDGTGLICTVANLTTAADLTQPSTDAATTGLFQFHQLTQCRFMLFGLLRLLDHDLFPLGGVPTRSRASSLTAVTPPEIVLPSSFSSRNHRPAHAADTLTMHILRSGCYSSLHNAVDWVSSPSRRGGDYATTAIGRRTVADCMEERDFSDEKQEKKPVRSTVPIAINRRTTK